MNTDLVSLKAIINNIKMHPLLSDVPEDYIIVKTREFIQIVGVPILFKESEADITTENYRAMLPCDYYDMIQVVDAVSHIPYVYSTASFSPEFYKGHNNTYKVQGKIIYTALESTKIHIAYRALYLDDEGYPMLIDNASFLRALESYIKMNWFTIQYDMGKISRDVKDNAATDYYGNVKHAETQLVTPTIDQMESLSNIFTSLLEKPWGHENTFRDTNKEYQLRLH